MRAFRDLSFSRKLSVLLATTSAAALALVFVTTSIYAFFSGREDELAQLKVAAATTSLHVAAAVAFDDAKAAADTLAALRANPDLVSAEVIAAGNRLLARYQRSARGETQMDRAAAPVVSFNVLTVVRPIELDGERIGSLRISADFSVLWRHLLTHSCGRSSRTGLPRARARQAPDYWISRCMEAAA